LWQHFAGWPFPLHGGPQVPPRTGAEPIEVVILPGAAHVSDEPESERYRIQAAWLRSTNGVKPIPERARHSVINFAIHDVYGFVREDELYDSFRDPQNLLRWRADTSQTFEIHVLPHGVYLVGFTSQEAVNVLSSKDIVGTELELYARCWSDAPYIVALLLKRLSVREMVAVDMLVDGRWIPSTQLKVTITPP